MFNREMFYGLQFKWYGFDKLGGIAEFYSGDLPIPKLIFNDETSYESLSEYFNDLPKKRSASLAKMFYKMRAKGNGDFIGSLETARKGLYSIEEVDTLDEGKHISGYYMVAIPEEPINVIDLPKKIRETIEPYYFPIIFSEVKLLDIEEFFDCD